MQIVPLLRDHIDGFPLKRGWLWQCFHDYNGYKTKDTQMQKMHK
jgi:hypothetical protein